MYMSIVFLVVIVSRLYTSPQTHFVVYIKYIQIFTCQSYFNDVFFVFFLKIAGKRNAAVYICLHPILGSSFLHLGRQFLTYESYTLHSSEICGPMTAVLWTQICPLEPWRSVPLPQAALWRINW